MVTAAVKVNAKPASFGQGEQTSTPQRAAPSVSLIPALPPPKTELLSAIRTFNPDPAVYLATESMIFASASPDPSILS
jgi:hypothetical protein